MKIFIAKRTMLLIKIFRSSFYYVENYACMKHIQIWFLLCGKTMSFDDKMQIWFLIWRKTMSFNEKYSDLVFNMKNY